MTYGETIRYQKPVDQNQKSIEKILKDHGGETRAEKKADGWRVQCHKRGNEYMLFTSGYEPLDPDMFPELKSDILKLPDGKKDLELHGFPTHENFTMSDEKKAVDKRARRTTINSEIVDQYPLMCSVFDIMELKGENVMHESLARRRQYLEDMTLGQHVQLVEQRSLTSVDGIQEYLNAMVDAGYEGLVLKDPRSSYKPGSRNRSWVKLKGFTTFDLVILGLYETPTSIEQGDPLSAVLCGVYNPEAQKPQYETIVKLPIKNSDVAHEIYSRLEDALYEAGDLSGEDAFVVTQELMNTPKKIPRYTVYPKDSLVIEVRTKEVTWSENYHSCGRNDKHGHSLQIASFVSIREDKTKELGKKKMKLTPTTTQEIEMYYGDKK